MTLVAGVDSSTQSCKVVVLDAGTGALVREGRAAHPDGTEVHPDHWWRALSAAFDDAGGLADVSALSVGGQQHGMVLLDHDGNVVRPGAAVERHPLGVGSGRTHRRSGGGGLRPQDRAGPGGLVHHHQDPLGPGPRTGHWRTGWRLLRCPTTG